VLAPLRAATAWPHRRRDSRAAPPLLCAAARACRRRPPRRLGARARAPPGRCQPATARTAAGQPPPRVPSPLRLARHRRCGVRGWAGKTPLPLTSGARWSVEGVGGIFLYLLIDFG